MTSSSGCGRSGFAPLQPDPAVRCSVTSVNLSVMEAKKFGVKDGKFAYGLVSFGGINHARTPKVAVKRESAFFGEEFTFGNIGADVLGFKLDVHSRGNFAVKDKLLAGVAVSFEGSASGLNENETHDGWHAMQDDGGNPCGSVRLKITLVKDVLLPTVEYKDLESILCNAGVAAPLLIGELYQSTSLNDYARDLNTIWRATKTTEAMLDGLNQALVASESRPVGKRETFLPRSCSRTLTSRCGSLQPSIYADVRYIDDVIAIEGRRHYLEVTRSHPKPWIST